MKEKIIFLLFAASGLISGGLLAKIVTDESWSQFFAATILSFIIFPFVYSYLNKNGEKS
jgi:hypothetical protein